MIKRYLIALILPAMNVYGMDRPMQKAQNPLARQARKQSHIEKVHEDLIVALFTLNSLAVKEVLLKDETLFEQALLVRDADGESVDAYCVALLGAIRLKNNNRAYWSELRRMITFLSKYRFVINGPLRHELLEGHTDIRGLIEGISMPSLPIMPVVQREDNDAIYRVQGSTELADEIKYDCDYSIEDDSKDWKPILRSASQDSFSRFERALAESTDDDDDVVIINTVPGESQSEGDAHQTLRLPS